VKQDELIKPVVPEDVPTAGTSRKPLVAIVGRPNVGKSTLFNRLLGFSKSIITETAGTTRDRKYGICEWDEYAMLMVDTGGMLGDSGDLSENIHRQALLAIEEADFIVFLGDVTQGIQDSEKTIARVLRQSKKPVLMVVNKCGTCICMY
jgi:GTP-binding protein